MLVGGSVVKVEKQQGDCDKLGVLCSLRDERIILKFTMVPIGVYVTHSIVLVFICSHG